MEVNTMWGCRDWSGAVQTKGCRQPAEAALGKGYTLPRKSLKEVQPFKTLILDFWPQRL